MVEKLSEVEQDLAEDRGAFSLFGVFLRKGSPDRWDIVVAAPWFGEDKASAIDVISRKLRTALGPGELLLVSRIVPLAPHDRFLSAVRDQVNVEHGLREIGDVEFGDVSINRGYVITSKVKANMRDRIKAER